MGSDLYLWKMKSLDNWFANVLYMLIYYTGRAGNAACWICLRLGLPVHVRTTRPNRETRSHSRPTTAVEHGDNLPLVCGQVISHSPHWHCGRIDVVILRNIVWYSAPALFTGSSTLTKTANSEIESHFSQLRWRSNFPFSILVRCRKLLDVFVKPPKNALLECQHHTLNIVTE